MSSEQDRAIAALREQNAALESLVVDLLHVAYRLAPDALENRLEKRGSKIRKGVSRNLGIAQEKFRRNIIAATLSDI